MHPGRIPRQHGGTAGRARRSIDSVLSKSGATRAQRIEPMKLVPTKGIHPSGFIWASITLLISQQYENISTIL